MFNNVNNPFGNRAISSSTSSDSNGRRQKEDPKEELKKYIDRETVTSDGYKVCLAANIGNEDDAVKGMKSGIYYILSNKAVYIIYWT